MEVAGLSIVAANRIAFVIDLVDEVFESVGDTGDVPGTYPCLYGGTASYSKAGTTYSFSAANCDTVIGGERIVIYSGSMQVIDPVVETTTSGYFLRSASITFSDSTVSEAGGTTSFSGSINLSSTVTSPTTAEVHGTGSLDVVRAGRTDSYRNIDVALLSTLNFGNIVRNGSLSLSSPRAPGALSLSAVAGSPDILTASAADGSRSILATNDGISFSVTFETASGTQESTNSTVHSAPLATAITRALQ